MCLLQTPLRPAAVAGFLIVTAGLWAIGGWGGLDQLHWEMVVLVCNYKGVRRPVPVLGSKLRCLFSLFCLWGGCSGLGRPCCSLRVCGAP